jgi:hypothetical protein
MLRRVALVRTDVVSSSPIFVNLMKQALSSSKTSVLTRSSRRNIPEDAILHSHRRENFTSYKTEPAQESDGPLLPQKVLHSTGTRRSMLLPTKGPLLPLIGPSTVLRLSGLGPVSIIQRLLL